MPLHTGVRVYKRECASGSRVCTAYTKNTHTSARARTHTHTHIHIRTHTHANHIAWHNGRAPKPYTLILNLLIGTLDMLEAGQR
jgi:hypothetical protein